MKSLISRSTGDGQLDNDEFAAGMLEYRNTPRTHGMSPAEILFGHKVRSVVPAHRSAFLSRWRGSEKLDERIRKEKRKAKEFYDKNSKMLRPLKTGTSVRIQDPKTKRWTQSGTIISGGAHRDYKITLPNGRIYWRNRKFIRPSNEVADVGVTSPKQSATDQPRRSKRTRRPVIRYGV